MSVSSICLVLTVSSFCGQGWKFPRLPIGQIEFEETGEYPDQIEITFLDKGRKVLLRTGNPLVPFVTNLAFDRNGARLKLYLPADRSYSPKSPLFGQGSCEFSLRNGVVVPIFEELYAVKTGRPSRVTLKRVTDDLPDGIKPTKGTLLISVADVAPTLFHIHQSFKRPSDGHIFRRNEFDEVRFDEFLVAEKTAKVTLVPCISGNAATRRPFLRRKLKLSARDGAVVTARGLTYRFKVVPPQNIDGVGHIVGWIELSEAKPAPSKDE